MNISLITTTKNRPELLWVCAQSVLAQTFPCYEWIICIDENKDELQKYIPIINRISEIIPQAKFINNNAIGRVRALNFAHCFAKGDYIGILDDDDTLEPACFKECSMWDSDLIYTDTYYYNHTSGNAKQVILEACVIPQKWEDVLRKNILFHFRMYKSEFYRKVGKFDVTYNAAMDYEMSLRMLSYRPSCTHINLPLYHYHYHSNSISGNYLDVQRSNVKRAKESILGFKDTLV